MEPDRQVPDLAQIRAELRDRRNWGRWGPNDQLGALNLITPDKRASALRSVRTGRTLTLSRPISTQSGPYDRHPAQHQLEVRPYGVDGSSVARGDSRAGYAAEFFGLYHHGVATTHLDALCHVWDNDGMWNGRDPAEQIGPDGTRFGGIEQFAAGVITRGVMIDVARHRGTAFVTQDSPVHGWELEAILAKRGLRLEPGDAVCVHSGREAWQEAHPDQPYGRTPSAEFGPAIFEKPGLHASCLSFLRDHDVAVLLWDMLDHTPFGYDIPWAVHGAIHAFGIAIVDNALLTPLATACAAEARDEFLVIIAPLVLPGGTGSPVNPIAVF